MNESLIPVPSATIPPTVTVQQVPVGNGQSQIHITSNLDGNLANVWQVIVSILLQGVHAAALEEAQLILQAQARRVQPYSSLADLKH